MARFALSTAATALLLASRSIASSTPHLLHRQAAGATGNSANSSSPYLEEISDFLDAASDELWKVNRAIHENPELGYKEYKAHDLLTYFLEGRDGWNVTRSTHGIETAFAAVFKGSGDGPVVSFNAEYDALQNLGHACGHNLIATVGLGGAIAAAEVMRAHKLPGTIILFGTPAEESLGGKVKMLEAGVFRDHKIDVSLMAHPTVGGGDSPYALTQSTDRLDLEYYGKPAHAAAAPYQGVNAQDALVLAYSALSMLRQQSLATDMVHGVITSGGTSINVIPDKSKASFQIRSASDTDLKPWTERLLKCFEAGALATGAELNLTMRPYGYSNHRTNEVLAKSYARHFASLSSNETLPDPDLDKLRAPGGSTDQGNISWEFPSIHPFFGIYNEDGSMPSGAPHTAPFEVAAGSKRAHNKAIQTAKSLAGIAVDVLTVDGMLKEIKVEFERTVKTQSRQRGVRATLTA
ncbi:aminobenzoyl-glutamate utilization protein B [Microdochium bolleyi]|uniref:Aminobenzoyl-glutamate utilization protein B n=1 Tax=Microdochium bolleyi TaxID=196109 RepID=A0A136J784_9PEZI|nr:aminobenzoyl-glutamate utilization protein B [Microdochium bolleyi]